MSITHIVKVADFATGAGEMFCGAERSRMEVPDPEWPVCTNCLLAALESTRQDYTNLFNEMAKHVERRIAEERQPAVPYYITDRLARLERKVRKIRKAKR